MSIAHPYPYLAHLIDAYFHRDAAKAERTDDDIVREFSDTSQPYDILGTRADSLRFLWEHASDRDFVDSLQRNFQVELSSGATGADARAWLARVEALLRNRQSDRQGTESRSAYGSAAQVLDDPRFSGPPGARFMTRFGPLGEHALHSQMNLRVVSTDPTSLLDLLYGVSLRGDCWCVCYATAARDGMYLGQIWLQSDGAIGGLYQELKGHPRLIVTVQRDASLDDSLTIPLPGGSCRVLDEWPEHSAAVSEAHHHAFGRPDEAAIVDDIRAANRATVSLVAQLPPDRRRSEPGPIVGHILFSPVTIDGSTEPLGLGLGPVAVLPDHQRQGIGARLIEAGLRRSRSLGYGYVVVLGPPEYYLRFGFTPASRFGLSFEHPVPDEVFMAIELVPGALAQVSGMVKYLPVFSEA